MGREKKQDVVDVLNTCSPDAVMISSLFHYNFIKENESAASDLEGNVNF
jgi:cyclase